MTNQPDHELTDLERQVLQFVRREGYQPVKPRVIAKKLELDEQGREAVRKAVKRLAKAGLLEYGAKHLVRPVAAGTPTASGSRTDHKLITGVYRRTTSGLGFVRPATSRDRDSDILIPSDRSRDAADGDTVAVRLRKGKDRGDGRLRGEVVEIIERETHRFVGVYAERGGSGYVQVDGRVFGEPIYVGDAGAKNVQVGDKVVVEMVRFPTHSHAGEAVIVEVLGPRGAVGVDTLSIIHEFGLPDAFSEQVLDAARRQAAAFDESIGDRTDFTGQTVITIDPVDARDFDDAISLEQQENGHWLLSVHIADVSHFVPVGSPLDDEARERATSVYLPDRVLPMLPEIISNNLASLQPDRVRYTMTAVIGFTPAGERTHVELHRGAIRSARRFTYEEVDEFLVDRGPWRDKLTPQVFALLERMHSLAMLLRQRRLAAGALELTLPEIKIDLDRRGHVAGAHLVQNTESHQIIEEFMLSANEAVAETLAQRQWNFLRRVHELPDPRKLQALARFIRELGLECEDLAGRFEIKRVIEQVRGRPEEYAVHFAVLRSMQKAVYSPEVLGHYALHSVHYCHFTSPIRRYPDLTIHRMVRALLVQERPPDDFDRQVLLGEHCSRREQRAEAAERELIKVKLLTFFSTRIGEELDAVITGVERFGLFARGTQLPAEGLVHITSLLDDHYEYDAATHSLIGRRAANAFRLGDLVRVRIAHVDVDRRELDFTVVKSVKKKPPSGRKAKSKRAPSATPDAANPRRRGSAGGPRPKRGKRPS